MSGGNVGRWAIIVHGGAKEIRPEEKEGTRSGVIAAASVGRHILAGGGSALDAVVARDDLVGWAHNSPHFAVALATSDEPEPRAWLTKHEERRG